MELRGSYGLFSPRRREARGVGGERGKAGGGGRRERRRGTAGRKEGRGGAGVGGWSAAEADRRAPPCPAERSAARRRPRAGRGSGGRRRTICIGVNSSDLCGRRNCHGNGDWGDGHRIYPRNT